MKKTMLMPNSKTKTTNTKAKALATARKAAETVKGVSVSSSSPSKPFRARLFHDNTYYSLGYYENVAEAAKAYNKKAKSLYGSEKAAKAANRWSIA